MKNWTLYNPELSSQDEARTRVTELPKYFQDRLDTSGGPEACWEWKLARNFKGYGLCSWHNKFQVAHRAIYRLVYGEIPKGLLVLHYCDNPPCCNPRHLWLGTAKQNTEDMIFKGRDKFIGGRSLKSRNHPTWKGITR